VLTGAPSLWQFCALQAVSGAALAFVLSAVSGLTPEVVAPERRQQANALRSFTGAAGNLAGPPIAGVIVAGAGAGYALAVDAATFAGSAVLLTALRVRPRPVAASPFARDLADGWRAFRSRRWILLANAHAAVMNVFVLAPFYVLGPAVAKASLGGAGAWALILTAFGTGLVGGSVTAASVRVRRRMLLGLVLGAVFAPPLALLALSAPAIAVAPFALLAGAQLTLLNTFWETTIQEQFAPALISRVTSIDWLSSIATAPLGFALAGVAGDSSIGLANTLGIAAAIALAASVLIAAFPSIRAVRASKP
jgi:predicted MFS family arabinose efflux permease